MHDGGQVCPDGDEKEAAWRKLHPSVSASANVQMEVTEFRMGKTPLAYSSTLTQFGHQHQP